MKQALTIANLESGYGRLRVFQDVSLTLQPNETVGLLGANGAGKTTLLNAIAGLLPAFSGRVTLGETDVTNWPAYRRARSGLALVPEGRQVFASLSVRDNLELARAALDEQRPGIFEGRLNEVYELFPRLRERLDSRGGSLSGGEQQMLAIARALLTDPSVLMLDEPTQGLAPIAIGALRETLRQLKGRFAIILVEQNKAFLSELADRVLLMRSGRLEVS